MFPANLANAVALNSMGFTVFPCNPDKTPLMKWGEVQFASKQQIETWWRMWPTAIAAIPCSQNGLYVVDCDVKSGVDGVDAWRRLCLSVGFDDGRCFKVATPSGGLHIYFRYDMQPPLGNTAGKIACGIDTRGTGGYVIAPGTTLPDGRCYQPSGQILRTTKLPDGLKALVQSLSATSRAQTVEASKPERAYAKAALTAECYSVATAPKGQRNTVLNNAAFKLGTLVPNGGISTDEIEAGLEVASMAAGLTAGETDATIRSALKAGLLNPRSPLPANAFVLPPSEWAAPQALPTGLLPVKAFDLGFLPQSLRHWVADISDRMQCPPDFVGVTAVIALGSLIGRKLAIRPQSKTDWFEVANLWGCIVGRPGAMKSPAMMEALKPLHRLEADARSNNERAFKTYLSTLKCQKADPPDEPKALRYIVNDCTYEALGKVMADNPNGVLAFRDELVSLLKTLDREDNAPARGFYLQAWNGTGGYTFDRITRAQTHIEAACLSLLGSTQPARIAEYVRRAAGTCDDGLIHKIWPTCLARPKFGLEECRLFP